MELYIEYVILDNYLIDYVILRLIEISTGHKIRKICKFLCCTFGVMSAIFLPFLEGLKVLLFCYRIISSVVMVMCIKKYKKFKNFATYYLLFITYTFLVGGLILAIIQLLSIEYTMSGLFMYKFEFPLGLFGLIVLVVCKLLFVSIKLIKNKLSTANYNYTIIIKNDNSEIRAPAFFDTGNNVCVDSIGVNIISLNLFLKLYKDIDLHKIILQRLDPNTLRQAKYVNIKGIGDGQKYLTFLVDVIEINGKKFPDTRVALSMKNFGDYECILHRDFIKG